MRLDVERHCANEGLAAPRRQIAWGPAGFRGRASRLVQGMQKSGGKERAVADERVPGEARKRAERIDGAQGDTWHAGSALHSHCRVRGAPSARAPLSVQVRA